MRTREPPKALIDVEEDRAEMLRAVDHHFEILTLITRSAVAVAGLLAEMAARALEVAVRTLEGPPISPLSPA